jgi:hypothetical protein
MTQASLPVDALKRYIPQSLGQAYQPGPGPGCGESGSGLSAKATSGRSARWPAQRAKTRRTHPVCRGKSDIVGAGQILLAA